MSAWYVFSALGLYPLPGSDLYILGAPRFPRATLRVPGGTFVIEAPEASAENIYVQSVELNGKPLTVPQLRQADLKPKGSLVFHLGKTPSSWGTSRAL
jgi:putative alpha-1,2-mannosidase